MGVNGTFFDANHPKMPSVAPATFALHDPKGKSAQLYITDYTINSALDSGFSTGNTLDVTYLLEHFLNFTVYTDDLAVVIPEVLTKYGKGKAVEFSGKFIKSASHTTFNATGQSLTGSLEITATIEKEVAIQASFEGAQAAAAIHSQSGSVFGNVAVASAGALGAGFKTTLGLTGTAFMGLVQGAIDTNVAKLNALLKAGIVIPKIAGIDVGNVEINFYKGYMELGLSLTPTTWEQVADLLGRWKQYRLQKLAKKAPKKTHKGYIANKLHQFKKYFWNQLKDIKNELKSGIQIDNDKRDVHLGLQVDPSKSFELTVDGKKEIDIEFSQN